MLLWWWTLKCLACKWGITQANFTESIHHIIIAFQGPVAKYTWRSHTQSSELASKLEKALYKFDYYYYLYTVLYMALCVFVWESQIVHTLITEWCHSLFQTALSAKSLWSHNLVNLPEKKKQKLFKHILPAECKVFLNNLVTSQQQTHIPSLLYGTLWSSMLNKTKDVTKKEFFYCILKKYNSY